MENLLGIEVFVCVPVFSVRVRVYNSIERKKSGNLKIISVTAKNAIKTLLMLTDARKV